MHYRAMIVSASVNGETWHELRAHQHGHPSVGIALVSEPGPVPPEWMERAKRAINTRKPITFLEAQLTASVAKAKSRKQETH